MRQSEFLQKSRGGHSCGDTRSAAALMQLVAATSDSIQKYDEQVEKLGRENYGHTKLVRQVTGVGPVTVLAYVSTLENPKRFTKSGESALRLCRVPG